ncbi:MAG: serine hydrolase [Pseudomonadota bacterium]
MLNTIRNTCVTLLLLGATSSLGAAPGIDDDIATDAQRLIDDGTAGAIVLGYFDENGATTRGFGQVSSTNPQSPNGDTRFEIGSVSKIMTAQLAEVLFRQGKLDWNWPLTDALPTWQFADEQVAAIVLSELAKHTSGLPRLPDNLGVSDTIDPYAAYDAAALQRFLTTFKPDALKKQPAYSNLSAGLLGFIAGEVAGTTYQRALSTHLLTPLNLAQTSPGHDKKLDVQLAQGMSYGRPVSPWHFDALAGAGAVVSTANDMLRWLQHTLDPNALDGALHDQLGGDAWRGAAWNRRDDLEGGTAFAHGGQTAGFATLALIQPEANRGLVVLATSADNSAIAGLGLKLISDHDTAETTSLEGLSGAYQLGPGFYVHIFRHGDALWAQATNQGAFELSPASDGSWRFAPAGISITFTLDDSGTASALVLDQSGRQTPASRDPNSALRDVSTLETEQLEDFIGRYQLTADAVLEITHQDSGHLMVQLTGQPTFPAFAFATDQFLLKVVDAQLEFERGEDGNIVAVTLVQNGRQRATRIVE